MSKQARLKRDLKRTLSETEHGAQRRGSIAIRHRDASRVKYKWPAAAFCKFEEDISMKILISLLFLSLMSIGSIAATPEPATQPVALAPAHELAFAFGAESHPSLSILGSSTTGGSAPLQAGCSTKCTNGSSSKECSTGTSCSCYCDGRGDAVCGECK